jgi:hypothetical protein
MRERAISAAPDDKQGAVWWEYSEKFIVPTQLQIYELLKTKWYLLIEGQVHQSIYEVINHCTDALSLFMLDKQGVKINNVPAQTMPDAFVAEIRQDLDSLRHEYDQFQGSKRRREARQASANFPT